MKMSIDDARHCIEHCLETDFCSPSCKYFPTKSYDCDDDCEDNAKKIAIDTMKKYQEIQKIIEDRNSKPLLVTLNRIIKVIENSDNNTESIKESLEETNMKDMKMSREEREDAIRFFKEVEEREVNNAKYSKLAIKALEQEPTYCPKFRNREEKHMALHTLITVEKFFNVIGNDDAIDGISILRDLLIKMEVEE